MKDRLQVLDADVSVEGAARLRSKFQGADNQSIAICNKTHAIAIANGRFVDLYGVGSQRFTFLTQITLGDYIPQLPSRKKTQPYSNGGQETEIVLGTCISVPIPGFLLVGAVVEDSETSTEVFVLGFRLFSGSLSTFGGDTDSRHVSVQVHFSFLEPVVGLTTRILSLQPLRREMTPDSGAVVTVFEDSEEFGVFAWKDRFSDRQVCLARVTSRVLLVTAVSPSGRYVVVGDAVGRLSLLDFRDYPWSGQTTSPSGRAMLRGKRLQLGICSRSGVIVRDNLLEHARLVQTTAVSDAKCAYTTIRWWDCVVHDQKKAFVLAGKHDGSLTVLQLDVSESSDANATVVQLKTIQIYPSLVSGKHDAIRHISEPFEAAKSKSSNECWYEFFTVSEMRWRTWQVKVGSSASNRHRLVWPSLKESLELPEFSLSIKDLSGLAILSPDLSPLIARMVLSANPDFRVKSEMLMVIAGDHLQLVSVLTKKIETPDATSSPSESDSVNIEERRESETGEMPRSRAEEDHEEFSKTSEDQQQQHPPGPITIQEKYQLPPMEWKAKKSPSTAKKQHEQTSSSEHEYSGCTSQNSKLSRADYEQRVASVIERVDNLSGVMKTMRSSFQLFSSDVQQHMNFVSETLDEMSRRVTQKPN